jgi:hypothetical protein
MEAVEEPEVVRVVSQVDQGDLARKTNGIVRDEIDLSRPIRRW